MKNKKIIIAGGSGFIGQAMARYFGKENRVVILSRNKMKTASNAIYWRWDGKHLEKHWAQELEGADIVINLSGKSVNCRYSEQNKKEIIESRTVPTRTLGKAIRKAGHPPKLWINAASATIYHNTNEQPQDEDTGLISDARNDNMPYSFFDQLRRRWQKQRARTRYGLNSEPYKELDKDFSIKVCKLWEQTFFEQETPVTRKVALRAAVTLGAGGVMVPYFNLLKFGLGGHQGNGKQMYSWVHEEDLCRIVEWLYEHEDMTGAYNCAAPDAVTNADFMRLLRRATGHRFGLPAFTWLLEAGAALIGTETELILKSRWVKPGRLLQSGFRFKYTNLSEAFADIVEKLPRKTYHLF